MKNSCLGVFIVALFILFFSITIILFVSQFTFLNPNFYKKQLEKADFYNQGAEIVVDLYQTQEGMVGNLDPTVQKAVTTAIKTTITPTFLKQEIEQGLTSISSFINLKTATPEASLDLEKVRPDFEKNLYDEVKKEQPMSWDEYQSLVYSQIEPDVNQILKKYSLNQQIEKDSFGLGQTLTNVQTALKVIRIIRYLSLGLAILFLALIVFLCRQSLRAIFSWTGWGVAVSGILVLILSLIFGPLASFVRDQLFGEFIKLEQAGSLIARVINQLLDSSAGILLWVSVVVLVVGLGMIIGSYFFKGTDTKAAPKAPPSKPQKPSKSTSPVQSAIAQARK